MGSIAHSKKRRERKTPMDFDNLEIMMGSIAHMARRGTKTWPMNFDNLETLAKCKVVARAGLEWIE
jgi:hypothetical protein